MKKIAIAILSLLLISTFSVSAQVSIDANELAKWEGRKYSMFIHWGIYAELGGIWDNKNISVGLSEQIQAHAGIYSDTYADVAKRFNPTKWNADSIAILAKNAGMKSIVFTSKHHDGFCMYHTQTTDFNIVDATPYKRDVMKELADACARHGLKFGLYYSLIDWHYPEAMPISSHNSDSIPPLHFEYNKRQVKEILTNYGEISELWFDMGSHSLAQSIEMKNWVRQFQPNCMVGGRIGNGQGDFMVMGDNQEPDYIIGIPWQSPASFFDETWGYRSWQKRTDEKTKEQEKLKSLIQVCSRGGNFLLNIGPRGDGSVVEYERDILLNIGKWLAKNEEAIYDTHSDPFHKNFEWGSVTSKANKLYLHVLNMPANRQLTLSGLDGKVLGAKILGTSTKCNFSKNKNEIVISIPNSVSADVVNVVEVSLNSGYKVPPLNVLQLTSDLQLNQDNAFNYYSNSGVDYNSIYQSTIKNQWTLQSGKKKNLTPRLIYSDQELGRTLKLNIGGKTQELTLDATTPKTLDNDVSGVTWGEIYAQEGSWSSLMSMPGNISNIDTSREWGKGIWTKSDYKNNQLYTISGGTLSASYFVQEITSPEDQMIVISVVSGDGVIAALNGDILINHGNLKKDKQVKDVLVLDLKKGKNQLFVKIFSNFRKEQSFAINTNEPQRVYIKDLPKITLNPNHYLPIDWTVKNSVSIHESMNMPNLNLEFNE